MHVIINHKQNFCGIYVPYDLKETYKDTEEYKDLIARNKTYNICVYVGGEQPLVPILRDLIGLKGVAQQ